MSTEAASERDHAAMNFVADRSAVPTLNTPSGNVLNRAVSPTIQPSITAEATNTTDGNLVSTDLNETMSCLILFFVLSLAASFSYSPIGRKYDDSRPWLSFIKASIWFCVAIFLGIIFDGMHSRSTV